MVGDSLALRRTSALGVCAALACSLALASPSASAGGPAPDPTPGPAPDPYTATAPAGSRTVSPTPHPVRIAAPSRGQMTGRTATPAHVRSDRRPKAAAVHPPAQQPRSTRTGPVRSFADSIAAAAETTHRLSRALALAVALLVLLSGAFVLTAAREIER